ncbi:MAG: EamA family transporter [Alphaproteobacteria bacterium]|nr:EamA family transporter [Alphaproteobacteria bacterium]
MISPIFFPFISAALYGLGYLMIERNTSNISVTAFLLLSCLMGLFNVFLLWLIKREPVDYSPLFESPGLLVALITTLFVASTGWMITNFSIRGTSAVYAAMGEISYPFFVLFFGFLFFGIRHFDYSTLIGGALIFAGSFIMIYGRAKLGGAG